MDRKSIDVLSLAELTEIAFKDMYIDLDVENAPEKRKADIIDSIWSDIYKDVFKPGKNDTTFNNCKSKLKTWDVESVESVVDVFIKLNKRYGGVIKYNQFSNLTGINRFTIDLWHKANSTNGYIFMLPQNDIDMECNNIYIINNNGLCTKYYGNGYVNRNDESSRLRFDVKKKLQEEMQDSNTNGLSNDTMGHALRANNEDELGKLYEPRRMIQQETIRAIKTAAELPQLGAINGTIGQIQDNNAVLEDKENG